jgi:hypothetical protein
MGRVTSHVQGMEERVASDFLHIGGLSKRDNAPKSIVARC